MYDVCIVGAGPAGSTLARLLGTRYRVLLADRRTLGAPFVPGELEKVCGGLLAPRAQAELARQGLGVPHGVVAGPQLFAVRTVDLNAELERLYQRFYVNVDREAFDRWLVSLLPTIVDTAFGWRAESVDTRGDVPMVSFRTPGGGRASVEARLVVGADGAGSIVRRAVVSALRTPARYSCVQARFAGAAGQPHYGAVFDESLTDFYGWTIPKGDAVCVGAAFASGAGSAAAFAGFVDRLRAAGFAFGPELSRHGAAIARPSHPSHVAFGAGNVALLGEAAGLISPSSAEGISFALRSGAALAEACGQTLDGALPRYRANALPLAAEVWAKLAKSSAIYGPFTRRIVMRSGIGALTERRGTEFGRAVGVSGV